MRRGFNSNQVIVSLTMATSTVKLKSYRSRSISLPTRSNNPLTFPVEEKLCRLKSSLSYEHEDLDGTKLSGLKDLYDRVHSLLQSSTARRALAHLHLGIVLNDVMDGSLVLLDTCSITIDVLLKMKEGLQDLQSSFRRSGRRVSGEYQEVHSYFNVRKKVSKEIHKCLRDLKRMENRRVLIPTLLEKDHSDIVVVISMLREVESITSSIFEALLSSLLLGTKSKKARTLASSNKPVISSRWCLVAKLMMQTSRCGVKTTTNNYEDEEKEDEENKGMCSEVEKVDFGLNTLMMLSCNNSTNNYNPNNEVMLINFKDLKKKLEELELRINGLEEGFGLIFKSLIETRVSLLNIISN